MASIAERDPSQTPAVGRSAVGRIVLTGMTASVVAAYLSRTVLAPAGSVIQRELQLSNREMGAVHGIWAFGYVGFQLPGGWLGDRFGRRAIMSLYGLAWSLCTVWSALAATYSSLWWSRLVFGAAQAGLIPCLTRACLDWFSEDRRGRASAAITAGMSAGAVAASGLAAVLVPWLGWRTTCVLFALSGIAWAAGFWLTFRDRPECHPWVDKAELDAIRGTPHARELAAEVEDATARPGPIPPARGGLGLYGTLAFWMLTGQGISRTFCYNFLTTWFPTFLERAHGVKLTSAGLMTMLPLAGVVAGSMGGGWIVDRLLRGTGSKWISRCAVGAMGMLLAGLCSAASIFASTAALAVLVLAVGSASLGLANPATWAVTMDLGGSRSASSLMALANMAGNLAALLCPIAVGLILDTSGGQWTLVLLMFALVSWAGALCWILLNPTANSAG